MRIVEWLGTGLLATRSLDLLFVLLLLAGCSSPQTTKRNAQAARVNNLRGSFGTYDAEPRQADGRVDVERLVAELTAIKANTYNFLVWRAATDWEDFKLFLPRAREHQIKVWVTLVPPSESPPHTGQFSEPFRLGLPALGRGDRQTQPAGAESGGLEPGRLLLRLEDVHAGIHGGDDPRARRPSTRSSPSCPACITTMLHRNWRRNTGHSWTASCSRIATRPASET